MQYKKCVIRPELHTDRHSLFQYTILVCTKKKKSEHIYNNLKLNHLGTEILLHNDVFYCVLPQHLFPPQARGHGGGYTGQLTQPHGGDLRCVSEGHHGGDHS